MENEKKKNNKKWMIPMFVVLGLALTFAIPYIVNSLTFNVGVAEPFTVQYAMLGDAGNYVGTPTCAEYGGVWFDSNSETIPTGNMYPGESRKLCVKITNAGEGDVPYVISSEVSAESNEGCLIAFPEVSLEGVATGSTTTIDGKEFTVPANSPVVENCEVTVNVARGTLE